MGSDDIEQTMHEMMPRMMENCLTPMKSEERRKMLAFAKLGSQKWKRNFCRGMPFFNFIKGTTRLETKISRLKKANDASADGSLRSLKFSKILVAIDGSENANRALEVAIDLKKNYHSKLLILNAVQINKYGKQLGKYSEEDARRFVDEAVSFAKKEGVSAVGEVKHATVSVVETIIESAEKEKVDLIVTGTRGLGGFKRLLLGSVSNGVVTHANCNVLVVR